MSLLNDITNPDLLQIQNELRLLAENVNGYFNVVADSGIMETTFQLQDSKVQLFERDEYAYLKFQIPNVDGDIEYGTYKIDNIKRISIMEDPQVIISVTVEDVDGVRAGIEWIFN